MDSRRRSLDVSSEQEILSAAGLEDQDSNVIPSHRFQDRLQEAAISAAFEEPYFAAAAIRTLSHDELRRLKEYSRWRIRVLGPRAEGRDYEDLLHESVTRTLDGKRNCPSGVDFYRHLHMTIKSISNSWSRKKVPELVPDTTNDGRALVNEGREESNPENFYRAKEFLARLDRSFGTDRLALLTIHLLTEGNTPEQIREALELPIEEVRALVRKVRRRMEKLLK